MKLAYKSDIKKLKCIARINAHNIIDDNCKGCDYGVDNTRTNKNLAHCSKCPYGIELQRLGFVIDLPSNNPTPGEVRRGPKVKTENMLETFTVEEYNELSKKMNDKQMMVYLNTTLHYFRLWKRENVLQNKNSERVSIR